MQDHPRCPDCPIEGRCLYQWTGHRPWCDWAHAGGAKLGRVRELSANPPKPILVGDRYPSLAQQARNLAGAVGRVAVAVATGQPVAVSEEEQARRLEICRQCPEFDPDQGRCRKCGCVGRWKSLIATERCPLDKW